MNADSVIDAIVNRAEVKTESGVSLADQLRRSHDPEYGTWDGFLVGKLEKEITAVLDHLSDEDLRCAWNELAEIDGCDLLEEGEFLCGPYSDQFLNPVLDAITQRGKPNTASHGTALPRRP